MFAITRLKNHLNNIALSKFVDGLCTSKLRYGLQLYGKVRITEQDRTNSDLKEIQTTQNRMMRSLLGKKLCDQIPTTELLKATKMLSINQLNAQIKLMEIWKATNIEDYPLKLNKKVVEHDKKNTRACNQGRLIIPGFKPIMHKTCITDAMQIWNIAPITGTTALTLAAAKNATKYFVNTLPT